MGLFGESVEIIRKIDSIRTEFIEMKRDFAHLEKSFERFVDHSEKKLDKIEAENEELRRRITRIEGIVDSTLKISMHDAIKSLAKEELAKSGNVDQVNESFIVKRLDDKSNDDSA